MPLMSARNVLHISFIMVLIAAIWICFMLLIAGNVWFGSSKFTGWIAVVGASFIFGSTGIPMKSPEITLQTSDNSQFKLLNALLFAAYTSMGIFIINFPVLLYQIANSSFFFQPWAVAGSVDIVIINIWAFLAVQSFGYAKAPAIWCSVGMSTAFLLGAFAFQEPIIHKVYGSLAIPLLVAGVVLVLLGSSNDEEKDKPVNDTFNSRDNRSNKDSKKMKSGQPKEQLYSNLAQSEHGKNMDLIGEESEEEEVMIPLHQHQSHNRSQYNDTSSSNIEKKRQQFQLQNFSIHRLEDDKEQQTEGTADENTSSPFYVTSSIANFSSAAIRRMLLMEIDEKHDQNHNIISSSHSTSSSSASHVAQQLSHLLTSFLYCFLTGIFDGALMVPYKLSHANDLHTTFSYLASFGIASCLMSILLLIMLYLLAVSKTLFLQRCKHTYLPGLCSGMLWAAANFMSVHATEYLGMRIGFPLTQTCVIFSALWGIFYFKEIDITSKTTLLRLGLGVCLVIAGSVCLGQSG